MAVNWYSVNVLTLPNIKYAMTSHPLLKWGKDLRLLLVTFIFVFFCVCHAPYIKSIQEQRDLLGFKDMYLQAATIRLPDCAGQSLFVQATIGYIIFARLGKYISEVSLHQSYHLSYKHQNHVLISYKSTNIFWLFNLTHTFFVIVACLGKQFYGQACPTRQSRKEKIVPVWSFIMLYVAKCIYFTIHADIFSY